MVTTIASYRLHASNLNRSLSQTAQQPQVEREISYYLDNIVHVKSTNEFLADDRLFQFAMKAYGLEDMSFAKAFMRKALDEGIDDPNSFANNLADRRYRDFVETFNFNRHGENTTVFERTRQKTVDLYVRQTLEENAGTANEGVRLALYFQRKAPEVTSVFGLMADRALIKVVQTALSLPASSSVLDIDKQAQLIERQLDIEELKDPAKLDRFIERFTAMWELESPSRSSRQGIPNVLTSGGNIFGLGSNLLSSLQNLKLGG